MQQKPENKALFSRHLANFASIMAPVKDYNRESILRNLRNVDIFRKLPEPMLEGISGNILVAEFKEGENIITKGESGDSMYVILEGKVTVHDDDFTIMELGPNNFFGEIALLTEMKRISSVTALSACVVGVVTRTDFYEVLRHYPDVTRDIMAALCMRILRQNETLISFLKHRENELVRLVEERTEELRESQHQQFLQEKMASLGQLSSGIAHEIKNPLNFISNFSILTKELLDELAQSSDPEDRNSIIESAQGNLDKIIEHGKRADGILNKLTKISDHNVGERSMADINTLAGEVIARSYSKFRNDYPDFISSILMVFTKNIPLISIAKEDLTRALGFIFVNAFESMEEKIQNLGNDYKPELIVETDVEGDQVQLIITDNGVGIKEENIGQIFLPFFTTKPTRRNTGVGLTLAENTIRGMKGKIEVTPSWKNGARLVVSFPVRIN